MDSYWGFSFFSHHILMSRKRKEGKSKFEIYHKVFGNGKKSEVFEFQPVMRLSVL